MAGESDATRRLAAMMPANPQDPAASRGVFHSASGRHHLTEHCLVPDGSYDVSGTSVENPTPRDEYDRNLITKGINEKVFLISSKMEKQVEAGLRRRALGTIFGGAALSIICLAILLAKLGLF